MIVKNERFQDLMEHEKAMEKMLSEYEKCMDLYQYALTLLKSLRLPKSLSLQNPENATRYPLLSRRMNEASLH